MAKVKVRAFRDKDGHCPLNVWLKLLKRKDRRGYKKCLFLFATLHVCGREIKMPHSKPLDKGIHELRGRVGTVNYRPLYSLLSDDTAIITHGFTKEDKVPPEEIELAAQRVALAKTDLEKYTTDYEGYENDE